MRKSPWWQLLLGQLGQLAQGRAGQLGLGLGLGLGLVQEPQLVLQALERLRHRSLWQRLQVSSCCCASTSRQRRFSRPARRCRSSSYQQFVRRQR
jgi:hypothetical protein